MTGLKDIELANAPCKLKVAEINMDQAVPITFEKAVYTLQTMVHGAAVKNKRLAWVIGKYARTMMDNEQRYGAAIATTLAARMGMSKSYLYSFVKLYEAYPRAEFERVINNPRLSLAHLVSLSRAPTDEIRKSLERRVQKEGLGQLETGRLVAKALGRVISHKPNTVATAEHKLARFETFCAGGLWHWVLCAGNGIHVAKSARGYGTKNDMLRSLQVVRDTTDITRTVEQVGL